MLFRLFSFAAILTSSVFGDTSGSGSTDDHISQLDCQKVNTNLYGHDYVMICKCSDEDSIDFSKDPDISPFFRCLTHYGFDSLCICYSDEETDSPFSSSFDMWLDGVSILT